MAATSPTPSALLEHLRDTLQNDPPLCSGTLALPKDQLELYYGRESPRFMDFTQSSSPEGERSLELLEQACDAAAFGKNHETVLDETYRKAGKMDAENFVMRFDAEKSGLIEAVRAGLLTGQKEKQGLSAELYKLNVYGKGAFFKAHVDTPRSQQMFGSLVVVLPTAHEGGQLVLRSNGDEWTFDAATLLSGRTDRIAYVAFFSDVEHEVLPVLAGHRVTITYNLCTVSQQSQPRLPKGLSVTEPPHGDPEAIKQSLLAFLRCEHILPQGGMVGFGLRHVYALPKIWDEQGPDPLVAVKRGLKGSDAALYRACKELGLKPRLRLVTEDFQAPIMLDHIDCPGSMDDEDDTRTLLISAGGVLLKYAEFDVGETEEENDAESAGEERDDANDDDKSSDRASDDDESLGAASTASSCEREYGRRTLIYWVTDPDNLNQTRQDYITYGNEASMGYMYTAVCLVADVGAYKDKDVALQAKH